MGDLTFGRGETTLSWGETTSSWGETTSSWGETTLSWGEKTWGETDLGRNDRNSSTLRRRNLKNVPLKLNSSNKPSQAAYKILITKKCTRPEKSQKK